MSAPVNLNTAHELVEANLGLVYAAARRFTFADRDEVIQSGCLGLTEAAKRFDASRGTAFSTYAVPYILGEIKAYLRRDHALHIPRHIQDLGSRSRKESDRLRLTLGREPTISEIAQSLSVSIEDIAAAMESNIAIISLDSPVNRDDGEDAPLSHVVSDESSAIPIQRVLVRDLVDSLGERERRLIRLRYFDGHTQAEAARILGVGQPQVSRMEKQALMRLRELAG